MCQPKKKTKSCSPRAPLSGGTIDLLRDTARRCCTSDPAQISSRLASRLNRRDEKNVKEKPGHFLPPIKLRTKENAESVQINSRDRLTPTPRSNFGWTHRQLPLDAKSTSDIHANARGSLLAQERTRANDNYKTNMQGESASTTQGKAKALVKNQPEPYLFIAERPFSGKQFNRQHEEKKLRNIHTPPTPKPSAHGYERLKAVPPIESSNHVSARSNVLHDRPI